MKLGRKNTLEKIVYENMSQNTLFLKNTRIIGEPNKTYDTEIKKLIRRKNNICFHERNV